MVKVWTWPYPNLMVNTPATQLQLTAFREGDRDNDGEAMIMRSIAAKLSNKDIKALSSYIEGLN